MIRVLHILTDSNIGGAGRLLVNLLRCFDKTRFEVTVALPKGSALIPWVEAVPAPVVEMEYGRDESWDRRSVGELRRLIRRLKPDVVHTHSSFAGRIAAWECGVKCRIYTRHCVFPPPPKLTRFPGKPLYGLLNRILNTDIIAVVDAAKENLTDMGVPADMITVILNGVEPVRVTTEEERRATREALGIGDGDFVCGISARLEDYKGHADLLVAAKTVLEAEPAAVFLIVGGGTQEAALKQQAKDLGIADRVKFTGLVPDVAPYYNIMDVNLNASWGTEASSLALSEGMSLGLPAIATEYGGNPQMILDGVNGLLVPVRDPAAMAEAILRVERDPELLHRLGEGARRLYHEKFTAEAMTRQVEKLYEKALGK